MYIANPGTDNQALYQLRDELKDLNVSIKQSSKTAEKLTIAMFVVGLIQLIVAVMQFIVSFAFSNDIKMIVWGVSMVLITGVIIFVSARKLFKHNS